MGKKGKTRRLVKTQKLISKESPTPVRVTHSTSFIVSLKKKLSVRSYVLFAIAICFLIYILITYKKGDNYINGNVTFLGNTTFSYKNSQPNDNAKANQSPLCGSWTDCATWGVEFFSRQFDLYSEYEKDSNAGTQYYITSHDMDMSTNPEFYFKAKIFYLKNNFLSFEQSSIKDIIAHSQDSIYSGFADSNIVNLISLEKSKLLNLVTNENTLHVKLLGDFPISALIPLNNSDISIQKKYVNNFNPTAKYTIHENYRRDNISNKWEYSMIDVLGPKIAIVCNPQVIQLNNVRYRTHEVAPNSKCCLVLLDVPFQARIAQTLCDDQLKQIIDAATRFYQYLAAYNGKVSIAPIPLTDDEFKILKNKRDRIKKIESIGKEIGNDFITKFWFLPKLSEYNGVYFYGQKLSNLICDEAIGNCQYGNESYDLKPSRKIELKNLHNFTFADEPVISPISYNPPDGFSTKFKGIGSLYIDNDLVGETVQQKKWFQNVLIVLTLLTTFFAVLQAFNDFKKYKTKDVSSIK